MSPIGWVELLQPFTDPRPVVLLLIGAFVTATVFLAVRLAARRDVDAVVDHVLQRRGIQKVNLMGWSWGTSIMASYTAIAPQSHRYLCS